MRINELIQELEEVKEEHGNLEIFVKSSVEANEQPAKQTALISWGDKERLRIEASQFRSKDQKNSGGKGFGLIDHKLLHNNF